MGKLASLVAAIVGWLAASTSGADGPPAPGDFKIQVAAFGLKKEPVSTEEIIVHGRVAYVFPSESKEVVIIEPGRKRVGLVDVGRKLQCDVSFAALDDSLEKIRTTLRDAADAREKLGGRGNLLEAQMTRDLFETKLAVAEGPRAHHVRLTNPAVEVDADGEPDADAPRLAMVAVTLEAVAKLGAFRVPNDLPPFAELEAIAALADARKLRPTELTYLYRLNGPPRKFRRTYRLVPVVTAREREALARVERLREAVPSLRYGQYRADR